MKNRSPFAVFGLGLITLGFYSWYWAVKTKTEMNQRGEKIPTAWLWLVPFIGSFWWYWKYSEAVEHTTNKELSWVLSLLLLVLLGNLGQAVVQDFFNKVDPSTSPAPMPVSVPTQPTPVVVATPAPIPPPVAPPHDQQPPSNTPPSSPVVSG